MTAKTGANVSARRGRAPVTSGATLASTPDGYRPATIGEIDTSTPVLVLGTKTHGSLGIIRSLGRLGVPVYGVDSDPRGPAAYSRYLRHRFVFDLAASSSAETVDYLLEVGKTIGSRTVLIPTWDETSLLVADAYRTGHQHLLDAAQREVRICERRLHGRAPSGWCGGSDPFRARHVG